MEPLKSYSHLTRAEAFARLRGALLLGACVASLTVTSAAQEPGDRPGVSVQPTVGVNPAGRAITMTVPVTVGGSYLGDIVVAAMPDGRVEFSGDRLLAVLGDVLERGPLDQMRGRIAGKGNATPQDATVEGVTVAFDQQKVELVVTPRPDLMAARRLQISPLNPDRVGEYVAPANFSAYLNMRGAVDWVQTGPDNGLQDPFFSFDGAARLGNVVLEGEALWNPGNDGEDFQYQGSRFVYDDLDNVVRWTLGDLKPQTRGYQSTPDLTGISVLRFYGTLMPQSIVRPSGDRSFLLTRPSTVEVLVNGQLVRRLQLDSGSYNLRDFPFAQGANDVVLQLLDDTGGRETISFSSFYDRQQLGEGYSEFGLFAGVRSPLGVEGREYTDEWVFTGFYRYGLSDTLTLGLNAQADETGWLGGVEGILGTSFGTIAFDGAYSDFDAIGTGTAFRLQFERLRQLDNGRSETFSAFFESVSPRFASLGVFAPDNRFEFEAGLGYSRSLTDDVYAALDLRYSQARFGFQDRQTYRASVGWRMTDNATLTTDIIYEDTEVRDGLAAYLTFSMSFDPFSSLTANYDTRDNRGRVGYQAIHGQGIDSYTLAADIERSDTGSGFNASANYIANVGEFGVSHFGAFDSDFGNNVSQRTNLRFASSIAIADGRVAIGRPIYDAFAIVHPHDSLKGADIFIDPREDYYSASTEQTGTAIETNITSYSERTLTVDAPEAPAGVDIGQGAFRLLPPYRAGYALQVGSDYSVTAMGRLIGEDGAALALIAGKAFEEGAPDREPLTIFTNRTGKFGLAGLKPGRWRLEMLSVPQTVYIITIPEGSTGAVKLGDVSPSAAGQ